MNRSVKATGVLFLIAIVVAFHGFCAPLPAQSFDRQLRELQDEQNQTRNTLDQLQSQLAAFETEIRQTEDRYENVYRQFQSLEREITIRDQVIGNLTAQRNQIRSELNLIRNLIGENQQELEMLMEDYKKTLTYLYKHGRTSGFVMMMNVTSLNQLLVRSHYLKRFSEHRERQANRITELQNELESKRNDLEDARRRNDDNLAEEQRQRQRLNANRQQQERNITTLRQDRDNLQQQMRRTLEEIENLNRTLSTLLAEENRVRRAEEERIRLLEEERLRRLAEAELIEDDERREVEVARYSNPIRRTAGPTSAELEVLEQSFAERRGRLPWPVDNGAVSVKFGRKIHPVYRVEIPSNGIEISTRPLSTVRAVHDGFVSEVMALNGFDTIVVVNHGRFVTAYGNLTGVAVRRATFVRAGDIIGRGGDENSTMGSAVFFMIRDGETNIDPEQWISRSNTPTP
jgi:murein hydrolase activator